MQESSLSENHFRKRSAVIADPVAEFIGMRRSVQDLFNFAIVEQAPPIVQERLSPRCTETDSVLAIQLNAHLFPYQGCVMDSAHYMWGVAGAEARQRAAQMAEVVAASRQSIVISVTGCFSLGPGCYPDVQIDREQMCVTGLLHTGQLQPGFHSELIDYVRADSPDHQSVRSAPLDGRASLGQLLADHPALVQTLFDMDSSVMAIVHPVHAAWDPDSTVTIDVCTVRRHAQRFWIMKGEQGRSYPVNYSAAVTPRPPLEHA